MNIIKKLKDAVVQIFVLNSKLRARDELLRLSDRQLEDSGFSRELLMNGVNDWPWRLDQALVSDAALPGDVALQTPAPRDSEVRHAIAELKSYSDRELAELGVNRNGIENAVRYGRPSIDDVVDSHKHAA